MARLTNPGLQPLQLPSSGDLPRRTEVDPAHDGVRLESDASLAVGLVVVIEVLGSTAVEASASNIGKAGMAGTGYQCAATLGWGSCGGKNCHFGVHHQAIQDDGQWSQNLWNEMHFPSAYSNYKAYGDYQVEPTAWCRSCGGGLPQTLNNSVTCCNTSQFNAKARWTVWAR